MLDITSSISGCLDNTHCPSGFTCENHKCAAAPGKVLIDSITIKTGSCDGCSTEGVTALLKGEPVVGFPYGVPCATNKLDRDGTTEFGAGGVARFDGQLNGAQNDGEEAMIGGCFHVKLSFRCFLHLISFLLGSFEQPTCGRYPQLARGGNLGANPSVRGLAG